jgi:TPR repeat protein
MRLPRFISTMQEKLASAYYMGHLLRDERLVCLTENHVKAAYWYRKAAEQGNASAQQMLGEMYDAGHGVPQDYEQAAVWMCKAAERGSVDAQCRLSWMYDNGHGVPQDYAQAAYWYRKAAEQGDASAQYKLGNAYALGQGVPQDYAKAFFWLDLAASGELGRYNVEQEDVETYRDEVASHLSPADLTHVHKARSSRQKRT